MFYRLVYPEDPDAIVKEIEEFDLGKRQALIYMLGIGRMAPMLHKESLLEAFALTEQLQRQKKKGKPKPGDIITPEDCEFAWQYLLDRNLIAPIELMEPKKQTRYRCPHNGVVVQYKDRAQLCKQCRRQFRKTGTLPEGDNGMEMLVGYQLSVTEEKPAKKKKQSKVEELNWPDEIDVTEPLM